MILRGRKRCVRPESLRTCPQECRRYAPLFAPGTWADDKPVGELAGGHHDGSEDEGGGVGVGHFYDIAGDNGGEDAGDVADKVIDTHGYADFLWWCAVLQENERVGGGKSD